MADPKWICSLSDGSTVSQDDFIGKEHNGAKISPWSAFLKHIKEKGLGITSMRLQINGITHTSPSFSNKAKFGSNGVAPNFKDEQWIAWRGGYEQNITTGDTKHFYKMVFQTEGRNEFTYIVDTATGDVWLQIRKVEPDAPKPV